MANGYERAAEFRAQLRRFLRHSEVSARAAGITPRQHLLLLQIAGSSDGTATVSELVERLALTQSAVTELVQRAEAAGLLTRRPSADDGRVVDLRLTDEGETRLAAVHEALGPERTQLRAMIDRLEE
jgi:DNA-binding MarR family transcriptional regulator